MAVGFTQAQIDGNGNAAFFLKRSHINHRQGVFVIGLHITAWVCHIYLAVHNVELVGLEAHNAPVHLFHGSSVDFRYISLLLIVGVDLNRTGITGNVGVALVKFHKSAVGNIDLPQFLRCALIEHKHLVGYVHHHIQFWAVNAQIVAHITHFLHLVRVGFRENIASVYAGSRIEPVERRLVWTHISLAQQIEAVNIGVFGLRGRHFFGNEHNILVAATRKSHSKHRQ